MRLLKNWSSFLVSMTILILPLMGFCSVESSLAAVQSKLIGTILPLVSIIGLVIAAISFVAGSANARAHLTLAIIGAAIGFGAPSIVSWIQSLIH